jgi:hypothetical protein
MSGACSFTFGGADVWTNHFFAANGNVTSPTSISDIGNAFTLPVPLRFIGFSFEKANGHWGEFALTINGTPVRYFEISGASKYTPAPFNLVLEAGSMIRLQAIYSIQVTAFASCLITLHFVPENSNHLFGDFGLNVIPFGGNVNVDRRLWLRFAAQASTALDADDKNFTTMFTVPAPMRLFRLGYQRSSPVGANLDGSLQLYKNGAPLEHGYCTMWDASGVVDFSIPEDSPLRQLNPGDVIQLAFEHGIILGSCIVTLYTTQRTAI